MIRRRQFMTLVGGAAAWPVVARAQQPMPVIGFLSSQYVDGYREPLRGFRQGLKESGYVEGENVAIEYRWAENQTASLPSLVAELIHRQIVVMAAMDSPTVLAAKAATMTIPIVFNTGEDPVRLGLVTSLARPGGNLTGVNFFAAELAAKRLGLLRELLPQASRIGVIVNPDHATITESTLRDLEPAARKAMLQIEVLKASSGAEIAAAFATAELKRLDALLLGSGPHFSNRRVQLALLAARFAVPTMYTGRQYVEAGGLISYGTSLSDAWRQVGAYAGNILKGAKPADLPVIQSSKFELSINMEAARILGLTIPPTLLARADEVIE
jgi:putative ABC transport system substrate-binding protein